MTEIKLYNATEETTRFIRITNQKKMGLLVEQLLYQRVLRTYDSLHTSLVGIVSAVAKQQVCSVKRVLLAQPIKRHVFGCAVQCFELKLRNPFFSNLMLNEKVL